MYFENKFYKNKSYGFNLTKFSYDNLISILCRITVFRKLIYISDKKTNNFINISCDSKIVEHNMKTLFTVIYNKL